jgi:glycosyltransferase involved in cell wall biosynthesis
MTLKKALFFTYKFPPMGGGGVQRSLKFVKYLPSFGWEPVVISADDRTYWAHDETLISDIPKDVMVKRLRSIRFLQVYFLLEKLLSKEFARNIWDGIFIPDDRIIWAIYAALSAARIARREKVSLIYSSSPPHSAHIGAKILKRMTGLPWVCDFRDLWTGDFRHDPKSPRVKRSHMRMEKGVLDGAERIICITDAVKKYFISDRGIEPEKLVTIYNGYDADDFDDNSKREKGTDDKIVISHSGSFYGKYFPETFFFALSLAMKKHPDLKERVEVRFFGVMDQGIRDAIDGYLKDNAVFLGYLDHGGATAEIIGSDINLLAFPLRGVSYLSVPGKIFEYLAAKRPILAVVPPGETADIVRSARAGVVISEDDPGRLSEKLYRAIIDLKDKRDFSPDMDVIDRFDRKGLTEKLAQVFDEVTGGR